MDSEILICPYCGGEQYTHEPDNVDALMANTECEHCGRLFWYSVTVTRLYSAYKDDGEADDDGQEKEDVDYE